MLHLLLLTHSSCTGMENFNQILLVENKKWTKSPTNWSWGGKIVRNSTDWFRNRQETDKWCALKDWQLERHVHGLVFDSTSSNTGLNLGACTIFEQTLGHILFQKYCPNINKGVFKVDNHNIFNSDYLIKLCQEMLKYYREAIKCQKPRDDYLELLNLCFIFHGGRRSTETLQLGVEFRAPGATHNG